MPHAVSCRAVSAFVCLLFAAACGDGSGPDEPPGGSVFVTTATGGDDPDPDGYRVMLGGVDRGAIAAAGEMDVRSVNPGTYVIGLDDVAGNCTAAENPREVTVALGEESPVTFAITCEAIPPATGGLQVNTTTTGPDADMDGYTLAIDGIPQPIGNNATLTLAAVPATEHTLVLSGVAVNCTVTGGATRTITVQENGFTTFGFDVTCVALPPA
jgi:hypothetical protein